MQRINFGHKTLDLKKVRKYLWKINSHLFVVADTLLAADARPLALFVMKPNISANHKINSSLNVVYPDLESYLPWFSLTASTSNFASGPEDPDSGLWVKSECWCLARALVLGEVRELARTPSFRSPCCKGNFRKHICPALLPLNHIYDRFETKPSHTHGWQIRMAVWLAQTAYDS